MNDTKTCTPDNPCDGSGHWVHPSAEDVGECLQGCCDRYLCPVCHKSWLEEVPA